MKVGVMPALPNPIATREFIAAFGRAIEERGFHSLWVPEHVVLFDEYASRYPYSPDGRVPAGDEVGVLDPLDTLAFLAGVTERIRLATGICLVPQRSPVYTAKQAATVDWLSGGRLDFGVGVGWLREEFEALGVPWERRGARTRECLLVMRSLWCDRVSRFDGEFYQLAECRQYPKPIQQPHPPIHFGGESDAALRRVAELGQGWYGFDLEPQEVRPRLERLDGFLAESGRSRDEIWITISPYMRGCDRDRLERYRDAGVDQVIVLCGARTLDRVLERLDGLVKELVEPALGM
ncbi:MAG: LLM class F420-dependent oxidoreductase [Myxococcota bacterium]